MKVIADEGYFAQSMLLSKALRMQQDLEDKKNEVIIKGLESKIKDHEAALEKKDFVLQTMEGSLAKAQAEITRLNSELLLKSKSFEQENKNFDAKLETDISSYRRQHIVDNLFYSNFKVKFFPQLFIVL